MLCDDYNFCYDNPCVNGTCHDFDDLLNLTYSCTCDDGLSDVNCSTEDECVTHDVMCFNDGVCMDLEGNYTCVNCTDG